jgi:hypothetical protein
MALGILSSASITWATGADPASQNVTPPAGCNAVLLLASFWFSAESHGISSVTLDGSAADQTFQRLSAAGVGPAAGAAVWYDPPTGSAIALDPVWTTGPGWGPCSTVVFLEDAEIVGWVDADGAHDAAGTQQTITLTTATGDLVIVHDSKYGEAIGDVPANESGYTSLQTQYNSTLASRTRSIVATGTTQAASTQDTEASSIIGIVFRELSGGGGGPSIPGLSRGSPRGIGRGLAR